MRFACCVSNAFCALRFETRQSAKPWNAPARARLRFSGLRLRFGGHSKVVVLYPRPVVVHTAFWGRQHIAHVCDDRVGQSDYFDS